MDHPSSCSASRHVDNDKIWINGRLVNDKIGCYAGRMERRPYHHGNLRETLLRHALDAVEEHGPAGWSLRDLARRAGVSHAAPAHHFGDKRGLLTAIATDGYTRLAAELEGAWQATGSFLEVGVAYVRFAVTNRATFEVMYRPDLFHAHDPGFRAAREASAGPLYGPLEVGGARDSSFDPLRAGIAAWSLVHGFAALWLTGNLPPALGSDPETAAREVAAYLFHPGAPPTR
jgi:AcrR family transcriptional regulator